MGVIKMVLTVMNINDDDHSDNANDPALYLTIHLLQQNLRLLSLRMMVLVTNMTVFMKSITTIGTPTILTAITTSTVLPRDATTMLTTRMSKK